MPRLLALALLCLAAAYTQAQPAQQLRYRTAVFSGSSSVQVRPCAVVSPVAPALSSFLKGFLAHALTEEFNVPFAPQRRFRNITYRRRRLQRRASCRSCTRWALAPGCSHTCTMAQSWHRQCQVGGVWSGDTWARVAVLTAHAAFTSIDAPEIWGTAQAPYCLWWLQVSRNR